jgi:hypothetical protein
MLNYLKSLATTADRLFFALPSREDRLLKLASAAALAVMFAIGLAHWYLFMNKGNIPFDNYDWFMNYDNYSVIKTALETNTVPFHISKPFLGLTNRFFAIAEISLSPQVLLLKYVSIGQYFMINSLLMFSAGFWGCLIIKRKYGLSLFSFSLLFLLFNFNGNITSHLAAGHTGWFGYFLLPFFCLFVLEMAEEGYSFAANFWKLPLTMFLILIQGTIHIFVWCIIYLLLFAAFNGRSAVRILMMLAITFFIAFFRILPGAITFAWQKHAFMIGFPNLSVFLDSLINIREVSHRWIGPSINILDWWEYDTYIDLIGLVMLAYFGVAARFMKAYAPLNEKFKAVDVPNLVFLFMSFNYVYYFVRLLPIPFIQSERVMSRIIVMPLVFVLIVSASRVQKALNALPLKAAHKLFGLAAVVVLGLSLAVHSRVWSLSRVSAYFKNNVADMGAAIIVQPDQFYVSCVSVSALISLSALVILACFAVYLSFKKPQSALKEQ